MPISQPSSEELQHARILREVRAKPRTPENVSKKQRNQVIDQLNGILLNNSRRPKDNEIPLKPLTLRRKSIEDIHQANRSSEEFHSPNYLHGKFQNENVSTKSEVSCFLWCVTSFV